jgi:cytochrome b561
MMTSGKGADVTDSNTRYGRVTKLLHWTVFLLLINQYAVAAIMLRTAPEETVAGFTQGTLYNWHKSVGVGLFVIVVARFAWRKWTPLPDWAPNLSAAEQRAIAVAERALYVGMFLMPLSGFVFVMAGDFGVHFFSTWDLPNPIGPKATLASVAQWTHEIVGWSLGLAILAHWALTARHHLVHRDRYVQRMLPFTHQR